MSVRGEARVGKYKNVPPDLAAEYMLQNLINKVPDMTREYSKAMHDFITDQEAQARYVNGVATWITIMRMPAVKGKISDAIQTAKKLKEELVQKRATTARAVAKAQVPA